VYVCVSVCVLKTTHTVWLKVMRFLGLAKVLLTFSFCGSLVEIGYGMAKKEIINELVGKSRVRVSVVLSLSHSHSHSLSLCALSFHYLSVCFVVSGL